MIEFFDFKYIVISMFVTALVVWVDVTLADWGWFEHTVLIQLLVYGMLLVGGVFVILMVMT